MERLSSLLECLSSLECEKEGRDILRAAAAAHDVDALAYFFLKPHHFLVRVPHLIHTFPAGWGRQVLADAHAGFGALVRMGVRTVAPVDLTQRSDEDARAIMNLPDVGNRGALLTVRSAGGETGILFASANGSEIEWRRFKEEALPRLQIFLAQFHETILLVQGIAPCCAEELLSRRELECLHWCAQGKSYWETAVILGIAERTVNHHMRMVREKLQVQTNAQAVSRAYELGLMLPDEDFTSVAP
ncbi:LuxR family transcriptional regulator [Thermopetrobacter sp. TC1]|uniref:helix-turn-helix transcriptional regulator n=1 Tax=Thermopetrobacter sp. TC1 TaxID=1495045 RepID=UPI0009E0105B|nr:LuxR family transcriptional regulator [Thermopetrobacter sp. TC1]